MDERVRTIKQNNALHKYCQDLADLLNESGVNQGLFLQEFEVDNSMESIKNIFREIGRIKYGKNSTAKLTTKEITEIYDEINRQTAKFGLHLPFPSIEDLLIREGKIY